VPAVGTVPGACPLYRQAPDGRGACGDRQAPYYVAGCVVWPVAPENIADYPDCSYTFERVG